MSPAELHKRVAEVLGVSSSQKELAFEVFTESVTEILTEGITLKIPRIGYFQIKSANQKTKKPQQLLFSSLPEDFTKEARTLYLTIDVFPRVKNPMEFDSQVFSIGVGKPLLPLLDEENIRDPEVSYAMLRKSIEERVREIFSESDQIPNFNIWDDTLGQEADELDHRTELNSHFDGLTKELDLSVHQKKEEEDFSVGTQDFLKSLLAENNFRITDDFSTDIHEIDVNSEPVKEEISSLMDDDMFGTDEIDISQQLSVSELLIDNNISDHETASLDIEQITSTKEDLETDQSLDELQSLKELSKSIFDEINFNEEETSIQEEEITIEPPSSAKQILIDQIDEESRLEQSQLRAWQIEDNHLQGIVNEELQEYDNEKIAAENSRILHDLLLDNEAEEITEISEVKEIISVPEPVPEDKIEITDDEEFEDDDSDENIKIEWTWGDELKEEFGIGADVEETEPSLIERFSFNDSHNELELAEYLPEEQTPFVINPTTTKHESYTTERNEPISESVVPEVKEFNFEKTRQDLFTRLEKTLERDVTSLKEELDKPVPDVIHFEPEVRESFQEIRNENKIDFKDEKVFLDFKTPPPKYEFVEEKEEPVLVKPKRITILLSPEEEEIVKPQTEVRREPEPAMSEDNTDNKKSNFGKYFTIMLSSFIVVTAIILFMMLNGKGKTEQANVKDQSQASDTQLSDVEKTILEPSKDGIQNINPDDLSDFPTTATAPPPIKQGTDLTTLKIPVEQSPGIVNQKSIQQTNKEKEPVVVKTPPANKESSNDVRVSNMIFTDGKTFNFQTSSWRRKDLADREIARLRDLGFNAFLITVFIPEKGGYWYRVRIGTFKTEQEASAFMRQNKF